MSFPLITYPSTLVWIDDDETLLASAKQTFTNFPHLTTFANPVSFLKFYEQYTPVIERFPLLKAQVESENFGTPERSPADVSYANFELLSASDEKQGDMSVMIVDYHMPDMTGIELCKKINNKKIKKILLTGELTNDQVIEAFNQGLIDYYIKKSDPKLFQKLNYYIALFTEQFFKQQTEHVYKHLELYHPLPYSDFAVGDYLNNWIKENNIREYYLSDAYGTLELIDRNHQRFYFVAYTDQRLNELVDLYSDNPKATAFLEQIKTRKVIPFFGNKKEAWEFDTETWVEYLYSAHLIVGRESYYICAVNG